MDGIRDHQLMIERMPREQICRILEQCLTWSIETPFYPGKSHHVNYEIMRSLELELMTRRTAE